MTDSTQHGRISENSEPRSPLYHHRDQHPQCSLPSAMAYVACVSSMAGIIYLDEARLG